MSEDKKRIQELAAKAFALINDKLPTNKKI